MKFRPCIDIHKGQVKQIVGGTLKDDSKGLVENFVATKDASYFAEMYKNDGLTGGHVIMLGSGNEEQAIKAIKTYPQGLQVGGGINPENAYNFLDNGASHIIVTSYVFKDGKINFENLEKLVNTIGTEKLVLDLSCRERDGVYLVVTDRWQKFTDFEVNEENLNKLTEYCSEFLIHGADVEGKCNGIQTNLVKKLGAWANNSRNNIPMTYAGGVGSFKDIEKIYKLGENKVDFTIGSALDIFGGNISYKKVVSWKPIKS